MRKAKTLYTLLGVLLAVSIAAFAVSRYETKKEQIRQSGEVVLEIAADEVTALSWTNESGTYSFSCADGTWTYDDDAAFPVDGEKIGALLEPLASFSAAFTIEDVEDASLYGLEKPVCTITIVSGEETHTLSLGDFSKMDEQRYVSLGDGKAYLATHDPLEEFDAVLRDMILDDEIPDFDTAEKITFTGGENYSIVRDEAGESICEDDVYFTDGKPLDTSLVESLLSSVRSLSLTDYVSYNVTEEELAAFGLDDPELTIEVEYTAEDSEAETAVFTLTLSQNPEEAAAYAEAVEEGETLPSVTCYARLNGSPIVYTVTQSAYDSLTAVSYDMLRHQKLFTADFDTATAVEVTLSGETFVFTLTPDGEEEEEEVWMYESEEIDISGIRSALRAVSASGFTAEKPDGAEEISLTVYLENETFPTFTLTLFRYDGDNCLALVNGEPTAFVSRSKTVDLIEAVNRLTL